MYELFLRSRKDMYLWLILEQLFVYNRIEMSMLRVVSIWRSAKNSLFLYLVLWASKEFFSQGLQSTLNGNQPLLLLCSAFSSTAVRFHLRQCNQARKITVSASVSSEKDLGFSLGEYAWRVTASHLLPKDLGAVQL